MRGIHLDRVLYVLDECVDWQPKPKGLPMDERDLDNRFAFHPANSETGIKHSAVRDACRELAGWLNDRLPEGREKSLAITHLEEVMMWGNAAIARPPINPVVMD